MPHILRLGDLPVRRTHHHRLPGVPSVPILSGVELDHAVEWDEPAAVKDQDAAARAVAANLIPLARCRGLFDTADTRRRAARKNEKVDREIERIPAHYAAAICTARRSKSSSAIARIPACTCS